MRALEPEVACLAALLSPSTGIIDSHGLMLAYQGDAEDHGAMIAFHAPVTGGRVVDGGIELAVGGAEPMQLRARSVVNSAGLHAPTVARTIAGLAPELIPPAYLCKGNYYTLSGARPFSHLVYPVPEEAGLGIHVTIDLAGQVRFGPDVEWIERVDYDVDPGRAAGFYQAIRQYYPGLKDGAIEPGYAGIRAEDRAQGHAGHGLRDPGPARARRAGPGQPVRDRIAGPHLVARFGAGGGGRARRAGQPGRLTVLKVASIGECMIELRHRSERELDLGFGGDTLNFAVYLARLARGRELRVDYVTALGDDPYSDMMLAGWQAEGVGCGLVARLPGRLPGLHTIRTDAQGERSFTYWRSASAARDVLKGAHGARIVEQLAGYDLLYLSGITLSILDAPQRATLIELAERIRARGGRVVFDSNFRPAGWPDRDEARAAFDAMLRRVDIALPTLDDDQALFGVEDAADCARRLHGLGVAEVAVKLGALGCWLSSGRAGRAGPGRAGGARGRQHRRGRQLQCRLPRGAPRGRGAGRCREAGPPHRSAGDRPSRRHRAGCGHGGSQCLRKSSDPVVRGNRDFALPWN